MIGIFCIMSTLDPLSHTLGRIEQALETITKTLSEDRMASATYRTEMRRDITAVRDMVHDLKNKVSNNEEDIAEIRPHIESWRVTSAQGAGVWNAAKVLWAMAIGLGATGLGAIIHAFWPPKN